MRKHTGHFQQPVSQSAFPMINMGNDAKIPDSLHRELGQVNGLLKSKRKGTCRLLATTLQQTPTLQRLQYFGNLYYNLYSLILTRERLMTATDFREKVWYLRSMSFIADHKS